MNCTLKIKDPSLKYFLEKDSFDSYEQFRTTYENKIKDGLIPIGNKLEEVSTPVQGGYSVKDTIYDNLDSLVEASLSGLLEEDNADLQFNKFIQSFDIYRQKYGTQTYISKEEKERDISFLKSVFNFYRNFPVTDKFKKSKVYKEFLKALKDFEEIVIKHEMPLEDEHPTNESLLMEQNKERDIPYIYTVARVYEASLDPVNKNIDPLAILRHNFVRKIDSLKEQGRRFFIRLEKDSALNSQTIGLDQISQRNIQWGVIGVVYELVGNEFKRVYISKPSYTINDDVEITTDINNATEVGKNAVKNFTVPIPDMMGEMYGIVNQNVRAEFITLRNNINTKGDPSPYYELERSTSEFPVALKYDEFKKQTIARKKRLIKLKQFLAGNKGDLRISTKTEGIHYAGNLFVQFEHGKAVLDRTPLNLEWKKRVASLVDFDYSNNLDKIDEVVAYLNNLLSFKGGDVHFERKPGSTKITVIRKSKIVDGKFMRVNEEMDPKDIMDVLEYARINVYKQWLETTEQSFFPVIHDGKLKEQIVNWYDFYTEHHETVARQVQIGNELFFGPIHSLMFYLKPQDVEALEKVAERLENPKFGNTEVSPDEVFEIDTILDNLVELSNQTKGATSDLLRILNELLKYDQVRSKLDGVTVRFSTKYDAQKKEYGGVNGKEISISWGLITNPSTMSDVFAHELIHLLTSQWISENPEHALVKELDALVELASEKIPDYNATRLEILSSLSNEKIASELKKIKVKDKSLYDKIVDILKDILTAVFGLEEFKKGQNNLYKELIVKLVQISTEVGTKEKKEPKMWKGIDLNNNTYDDTDAISIFGYNEESLKVALGDKPRTYLKKVVNTIDSDIFFHISHSGTLGKFVTGEMDFTTMFRQLFNGYANYVKLKSDNLTKNEEEFYEFVLGNRDFIESYWLKNTNAFKVRKNKKGEVDNITPADEDVEETKVAEDTDTGEEGVYNSEMTAMTEQGGNETKLDKDRGMDTASIDAADPLSRLFIKMLPKIEREHGIVKEYTEEQATTRDYIQIPGTTRYLKIARNEFNRFELCNYTNTWNLIAIHLEGKLSLQEMLDYINNIGNNNNIVDIVPEILVFAQRLSGPIKDSFDAELRGRIETSFKRARVDIQVLLDNKGLLTLVNESNDILKPAQRMFDSAIVSSLNGILKPYLIQEPGDNYGKIDFKKFIEDRKYIKENGTIDSTKNIFKDLGLYLHHKTVGKKTKTTVYSEFEKAFFDFVEKYKDPLPVALSGTIIKDHPRVLGLNNYFMNLFREEHKNNPLAVTTMVNNAEGEKQSYLSEFNSLLQYRKYYNEVTTIEELNELIPRTKNDMFNFSIAKDLMFKKVIDKDGVEREIRTHIKLDVGVLSGLKQVREGKKSQGLLTIDLPTGDWIKLNFVTMLKKGIIENTRAETATTSYYTKLSNYSYVDAQMTPLKFSDINEVWNRKEGKVNIVNKSVFTVWARYLEGELSRIRKQGGTPKWGLFKDILTDSEKNTVLNEGITFDNLKPALDRFFQKQYEEFSKLFKDEMGGVYAFQEDSGMEKFLEPNVIDQWKLFFVLNTLTLHTEETILFQGDLSQTPKYFKRAKGIQSTGTPQSKDENLIEYINSTLTENSFSKLLGKEVLVGNKYDSATIEDDVKVSEYYKNGELRKAYIESKQAFNESVGKKQSLKDIENEADTLLEPYKEVNIGDGDGFIHPDMYFALLHRVGNINQDQIKAYKALILDAKKNAQIYNLGLNQELTEEEEKLMNEGLDLISKGKAVFPKLKVTYRGNSYSNDVVAKEIMDKFALFPLFPQFTYDKPAARSALMQMTNEGIAYIKFKSGTKIDNHGITDFLNRVEKEDINLSFEDSKHTLSSEYLREQIKTPTKVKDKNTFGTQFRKLITNITDPTLRKKWDKLNQDFSKMLKTEILGRFGITEKNGRWNYDNINKAEVAKVLIREGKNRDLPENILIYFDKYLAHKRDASLEEAYEFFESSFGAQQIQNLLASIIKKISIQKLKGAQLVQVSQSLFDRSIKVNGKTRDLGFYHIKDGKVQAAECKVAMMGDFRNLLYIEDVNKELEFYGYDDNELSRTRVLNKLLQNDDWVSKHEKQLTIIGYRIPTQGFNSMEVMVVREFLPAFHGNTIVCPPEITTQSGTDYDYDKLSVILPSINKEGELVESGSYGVQNEMINTAKEMLLSVENFHKLVTPNTNKIIFDLLKGTKEKEGLLKTLGIDVEDPKATQIITFFGNLKKFKAVKGKGLLGIAAVWNPFTVLLQNHGWVLNDTFNKKIGYGNKMKTKEVPINPVLGGSLSSKDALTSDGTSKLEIISQLINVTVDMPSDDTFGQTIFNKDDFSALIYSISMLGYSFETAMKFFHQPIIWAFKARMEYYKKLGHSKNSARLNSIAELLDKEVLTSEEGFQKLRDFESELLDDLNILETQIDISKFDEELKNAPLHKWNTHDQFSDNQKAVLAHYYKVVDQASEIRTIQSALNFDTSPDNNVHKAYERMNNYSDAMDSGIVSKEMIASIRRDSVISGLYVSNILTSITENLFPVLFKNNRRTFLDTAEEYGDNNERAFTKLTNDFLLAIVQNFGSYKDNNIYNYGSKLLVGVAASDLVNRGKAIKEKLDKESNSPRLLNILLADVSKRRNIINPQIFLGMENSPEEKDAITDEWRQLLKSTDPQIRQFAEDLAITGLVQSGWSKSPVYFSDIIPEEFVTPIINEAINIYRNLPAHRKEAFMYTFIQNFKYSEGGTLGKDNSRGAFLSEPFRLIDFTNRLEENFEIMERLYQEQLAKKQLPSNEEFVEQPVKTEDVFKYYGAMYTINLDTNGKGVSVKDYKGKKSKEQKLLDAYNTNPNVDPQNGEMFRKSTENIKVTPSEEGIISSYTFKDGYTVETKFPLNEDQKKAISDLENFIKSKDTTITLSGAAGTGKSTLISIFNKWLEEKRYIFAKYSAPTHRANAVTKLMNPYVNVYTLHQLFGLTPDIDLEEGNFDVKDLEFNQNNAVKIESNDVLIIDESSMINDALFEFIKNQQKKSKIRVIYVGDVEQLKPVKQKHKSKVFTSTDHKVITLNKVERTGDNAILEESVNIRSGKDWSYQTKINSSGEGVVYIDDRSEMLKIAKDQFIAQSNIDNKLYFRILSATNKGVGDINGIIRKILFGTESSKQLIKGDILMGYDNFDYNYSTSQYKLYNGGDYEVVDVTPSQKYISEIDETFSGYDVVVKNLLDNNESPQHIFVVDNSESDEKLIKFADIIQELQKQGAKMMRIGERKEGAYLFNKATKLKSTLAIMRDVQKFDKSDNKGKTVIRKTFDYGYAHTIHKSQGGTYNKVLILADTINSFSDDLSKKELKYVSVSRAKEVAYIRTSHPLKPIAKVQEADTADTSKVERGFIPMQPDNIEMIKSGRVTQTIRTENLKDGIYTLPDGTKVILTNLYGGSIKSKDIDDKDQFAYAEGFKDWKDFEKNNKFSSGFIEGNQSRVVYKIELYEPSKGKITSLQQKTDNELEKKEISIAKPQNITSNSKDAFSAALTNPTTLSKKKGNIRKDYQVVFKGVTYKDAEEAYKANKIDDDVLAKEGKIDPRNNNIMIDIITAKLKQHPELINELTKRGGVKWLEQSEHTVNGNRFEGKGRNSAFINNLIIAYENVLMGDTATDRELLTKYIDNAMYNKYSTSSSRKKLGINVLFIKEFNTINEAVNNLKSRIKELTTRLEEEELKEDANDVLLKQWSDNVQALGELIYDLENLRSGEQKFGYNEESKERCINL